MKLQRPRISQWGQVPQQPTNKSRRLVWFNRTEVQSWSSICGVKTFDRLQVFSSKRPERLIRYLQGWFQTVDALKHVSSQWVQELLRYLILLYYIDHLIDTGSNRALKSGLFCVFLFLHMKQAGCVSCLFCWAETSRDTPRSCDPLTSACLKKEGRKSSRLACRWGRSLQGGEGVVSPDTMMIFCC